MKDFAFPQHFVRGLGAAPSHPIPAPVSSPIGPHLVSQKKGAGDPNYYPTTPQFDPRGFWHSAGSFHPVQSPHGIPVTPPRGEWLKQGTVTRNGRPTPLWIWYPLNDNVPVLLEGTKHGIHDYVISRTNPVYGHDPHNLHLFSNPDYWAVELGTWKTLLLSHLVP